MRTTLRASLACPVAFAFLALCAAGTPAQGGIHWPDPNALPKLTVRQLDARKFVFCFSGWSTVVPAPDAGGDSEGAAVGVPTGARTTNSATVVYVEEGSGDEADMPLFPFVKESGPPFNVANIFKDPMDGLDWYGFIAPVTGAVPERAPGLLCFEADFTTAPTFAFLRTFLPNIRVGVATVDAAGNRTGAKFELPVGSFERATVLDFHFDRGDGDFAINYAGAAGGAKTVGPMKPAAATAWAPGRFGTALRGDGSWCDTRWEGHLGGSFTVAWFMKQRTAPAGASPFFAGLGGFRCFTGGGAGTGLRCEGWTGGGSPAGLNLGFDVQTAAQNAWVHIALVVDHEAGNAEWFVDGVLQNTIAITGLAAIPDGNGSTFLIGRAAGGAHSTYDIDEFRLVNRPVAVSEIRDWTARSPAAGTVFSESCGANLRLGPALPQLGQPFGYRLEGPVSAPYALLFGGDTRLGPLALPFDLGLFLPGLAGCPWHSSNLVNLPGMTNGIGLGGQIITVPNNPVFRGLNLYNQGIFITPGGAFATNAHAIEIE